jgi:8-oxo-dGTP pyrophosphatase MutT (NUDIX family)
MTQNPTHAAPHTPDKAGIFLYGRGDDGRMHTLVSYSEGRFGSGDATATEKNLGRKCYGLAKGAIHEGETAAQAAARETREETGIDLQTLLGKENFKKWLKGETLTNMSSEGYPGVHVVRIEGAPREHDYRSSHGVLHKAAYFAIEVEGIEQLAPHLKKMHPKDNSVALKVIRTADQLAQERHLPNFHQVMEILRTGKIPHQAHSSWANPSSALPVIANPSLPKLLTDHPPKSHNIYTHDGWHEYWKALPETATEMLKPDLRALKQYFERCGIVGNEGDKLKFDTKLNPGSFYQEGGEIQPVSEFLERSATFASEHPLSARSMWGAFPQVFRREKDRSGLRIEGNLTPVEQMQSAQIAPFVTFFSAIDDEVRELPAKSSNRFIQRMAHVFAQQPETPGWTEAATKALATERESSGR